MAIDPFPDTAQPPGFHVHAGTLRVRTRRPVQFLDVTELVDDLIRRSGISDGIVQIQTRHTTTAVVVNENEPMLLEDVHELLARWAPKHVRYRHDAERPDRPSGERDNGHAHGRALLLGGSVGLNVVAGEIQLGTWQRILLVELDGPREREVSVTVLGLRGAGARGARVATTVTTLPRAKAR